MLLAELLIIASGLTATTYGHGEGNCGDVGSAVSCQVGAITSSGVAFDPEKPQAAIAAPTYTYIKDQWIGLKVAGGKCHAVHLVDKMHERWIGVRGFDLTPAAVKLLTGKPATPYWSGKIYTCQLPVKSGKMKVRTTHGRPTPWIP